MKAIGGALWLLGMAVFLYAAFGFDVSIPSSTTGSPFGGPDRIVNMDLQQRQLLLALAGLAMFMSGVLVHAIGEGVSAIRGETSTSTPGYVPEVADSPMLKDEDIGAEEMERLGITFAEGQFRLGPFRYDRLVDAVAYAKRPQSNA